MLSPCRFYCFGLWVVLFDIYREFGIRTFFAVLQKFLLSGFKQAAFIFVISLLLPLAWLSMLPTLFAQTVTYTYDEGPNGIGRLSAVSDPTGKKYHFRI